jgi:hypothetical protein
MVRLDKHQTTRGRQYVVVATFLLKQQAHQSQGHTLFNLIIIESYNAEQQPKTRTSSLPSGPIRPAKLPA